jgi:hypothetical protein
LIRWLSTALILMLVGCSSTEATHPWLDLGESSAHEIIEFAGADAGQIVIAMEPQVTREEALALGRLIQAQAPAAARVNARLYNDAFTARGWRTAPAQMRVAHLLVLVSINPETGLNEVRWAPPEALPDSIGPVASQSGVPSSDTN